MEMNYHQKSQRAFHIKSISTSSETIVEVRRSTDRLIFTIGISVRASGSLINSVSDIHVVAAIYWDEISKGQVAFCVIFSHVDVIKWKYFPRYWPFVRGIHRWPSQRPVTRSFDVFFDLCLNKRLSKQSCGGWFETPSRPLWRHRNACVFRHVYDYLRCVEDMAQNYGCSYTAADWQEKLSRNVLEADLKLSWCLYNWRKSLYYGK